MSWYARGALASAVAVVGAFAGSQEDFPCMSNDKPRPEATYLGCLGTILLIVFGSLLLLPGSCTGLGFGGQLVVGFFALLSIALMVYATWPKSRR
jgi:hypothetical protein